MNPAIRIKAEKELDLSGTNEVRMTTKQVDRERFHYSHHLFSWLENSETSSPILFPEDLMGPCNLFDLKLKTCKSEEKELDLSGINEVRMRRKQVDRESALHSAPPPSNFPRESTS
uniref:Uncharacterized protein n=1 Tax=Solanum lycopersicum TaxID=4081 RepID=A0A3Q7E8K3_SOLLC